MFENLTFTLRRLRKNKFITLVNLFGLCIGIFVSIALVNYYAQQQSYDKYHTKASRIYKAISRVEFNKGGSTIFPISFGTLGESLESNFQDVEKSARVYGPETVEVDLKDKRFNDQTLIRLDYSFFHLFDFPGVKPEYFNAPNEAILSKETAQKLFNGNAIGQLIKVEGEWYKVSAVADIPQATVFKFDIALPLVSMPYYQEMNTGGLEFETYILLNENNESKTTLDLLSEHSNRLMEKKWKDVEASNFFLQLKEVYLNELGVKNRFGNGDKTQLNIILFIAVLVLVLALINYMNLQIATNHARLIEMRLRKILGAGKKTMVRQGIIESSLLFLGSSILALILLESFYRSDFSSWLGNEGFSLTDWRLDKWALFVFSLLFVAGLTGSIPSIKLFNKTGFSQQLIGDKRLGKLTISLVIFQFLVTSSLLLTIMFINKQMNHLRLLDKGYDSEQIVMVNNTGDAHLAKYQRIQDQLLKSEAILSVGGSQNAPGQGASGQSVHRRDVPDESIKIAHIRTLSGYSKTLGLTFTQGGDFTIDEPGGEGQFILNETAASLLFKENESILGETINMSGRVGKIVGVVEDFNYLSFKQRIAPLALNVEEPFKLTLLVKIKSDEIQNGLNKIDEVLSEIDPLYVFDYQFLDDQFAITYSSEIRIKRIITYATVLAFVISALGLLSLSLFVINSKQKEIAIRKVLGGDQIHIFRKLSDQLVSWILMANLIAIPIAWYVANIWVQDFIYQIDLSHLLWMAIVSTITTLGIGMIIILKKLMTTINMNPVEFLSNQ